MGDSFRSAAWDSQLDNMLDDLQQVMVFGFCLNMLMILMVIATLWAEYGGDDVVDSSTR